MDGSAGPSLPVSATTGLDNASQSLLVEKSMSWISPHRLSGGEEPANGSETQSQKNTAPIRVLSLSRIFPKDRLTSPQTIPLSILDATCAAFSTTSTVLFYDPPRAALNHQNHFPLSLSSTLNAYPQLCGRIHLSQYHYSSYKPEDGHTHRFGRIFQTFGKDSDPGAELRIVECPRPLSMFLPNISQRRNGGHWDPSGLPSAEFISPSTLALSNIYGDTNGLPCLAIQITAFKCGSIAIGFRLVHALADANSLAYFIHDWAAVSRAMANGLPTPELSPSFDPQLLDRQAAGDIDAAEPDAELVRKSRSLNCHRFDWYAFDDGRQWGETKVPDGINAASIHPLGTVMPWDTWCTHAPTLTSILHFSATEIQGMWKEATTGIQLFVSHHDAIIAHIWKLVNRARKIEDHDDVHIDYTIGFRERLSLPDSFMGSPIAMANIAMKGKDVAENPLSELASKIRSEVAKYDVEHIKALLHDEAFEENPLRFWKGFLGNHHLMTTSWIHTRLSEIDFGMRSSLRFVDTPLPSPDGLLVITEAVPEVGFINKNEKERQHWTDHGVDLRLSLESEAMTRLLSDPLRTKYSTTLSKD